GPKMIWQFGELGYDISIDENGRTGEKPILWDYLKDSRRYQLYKRYGELVNWKKKNAIFRDADVLAAVEGEVKYYILSHNGQRVLIIGNFGVVEKKLSINAQLAGTWQDNTAKKDRIWTVGQILTLDPGEYYILSSTLLN